MDERWLPVAGSDFYEVSDLGRVRSVDRVVVDRNGVRYSRSGRVLRPGRAKNGYLTVALSGRSSAVHALVLTAFVGSRPDGCDGSHLNGNRADNVLGNLIWEPRQANMRRAMDHGTVRSGERHSGHRLTTELVTEIRRTTDGSRTSARSIATRMGLSFSTVLDVVQGRTWKGVGCVDAQ